MNVKPAKMLRTAFGETLLELGSEISDLVVLDADISSSLKTEEFAHRFPKRHFNFGVAEQNMFLSAAGLATMGLIPFACTYATFASLRACEQIRSFIGYGNLNVKIISTHGGIEVGWDGATHQAIEDVAIMRAIPNLTVVVPADAISTSALIRQVANYQGPVYFRMGRNDVPILYSNSQEFLLGEAVFLSKGGDVTLIAMGVMVAYALEAAEQLSKEGIQASVLDLHTVKPLDQAAVLQAAQETQAIVTLEDHSIVGGLGSAVAEFLAEVKPTHIIRIGIRDTFCESGDPLALFSKYGLSVQHIVNAVHKVLSFCG